VTDFGAQLTSPGWMVQWSVPCGVASSTVNGASIAVGGYRLQAAKNLILKAFLESTDPVRVLDAEAVAHA